MSHQTGITPSQELNEEIAEAKKGGQRILKIIIENEQLVLADKCSPRETWEEDFDALLQPMLEEKKPCYVFYRMDTKNDAGFKWLFIAYIPDNSEIRQKMLYASTKSTMKMSFGGRSHVDEELSATLKSEATLDGYRKHLAVRAAPGPLTDAEMEKKMVEEMETRPDIGIDSKAQTLPGLSFPVDQTALASIRDLKDEKINYVQLEIDVTDEVILLSRRDSNMPVSQLPSITPSDSPRYHLFRFSHVYEGQQLDSKIFIYSMPGYACSVKERMLYSSCKATLLFSLEQMGLPFETKIEISEANELTEDFLFSEVHPIRNIHKPKFEKPKGPAGRKGQSRMIGANRNAKQ